MDYSDDDGGPPRPAIIAAVALAVVAIGVILVIAATREAPPRPVAVAAVPAPQADGAACRALSDPLPQRLGDHRRAPHPTAPGWRAARGTGGGGGAGCAAVRTRPPRRVRRGFSDPGRRPGAV